MSKKITNALKRWAIYLVAQVKRGVHMLKGSIPTLFEVAKVKRTVRVLRVWIRTFFEVAKVKRRVWVLRVSIRTFFENVSALIFIIKFWAPILKQRVQRVIDQNVFIIILMDVMTIGRDTLLLATEVYVLAWLLDTINQRMQPRPPFWIEVLVIPQPIRIYYIACILWSAVLVVYGYNLYHRLSDNRTKLLFIVLFTGGMFYFFVFILSS